MFDGNEQEIACSAPGCFSEMSRVGGEWKNKTKCRLAASAQLSKPKLQATILQADDVAMRMKRNIEVTGRP